MSDHFSYTQYGMYLRCPAQYEFRYVHGIKEPPGSGLVLGKATHRGLEYAIKEHIEHGAPPPLDFVKEATRAAVAEQFDEIPPSEIKWEGDDTKASMVPSALGLVEVYDPVRVALVPTESEREFALDTGGTMPMVGVLDIETRTAIVDIKTAKRKKSENAADRSEQLTVYQAAREAPVKTLELHVLVKTKTPAVQILRSPARTKTQIADTFDNIAVVTKAIAAGNFPKVQLDAIGSPCSWCGFFERCRGYKRPSKEE